MQADFYILDHADKTGFACRLIEKIYLQSYKVLVYFDDQDAANAFNKQLWTFRDISFVPHTLSSENEHGLAPVMIHLDAEKPVKADVLMILSEQWPRYVEQYDRVVFVVPNEERYKQIGRQYYKELTEKNISVEVHKITG